jgi:molybdopterin-guanine dinucleotide biosynthesis protein A
MILVNGNHFTAKEQIVLLHSAKKESLQRKLDRLTNVVAVVEMDDTLGNYQFLQEKLGPDVRYFKGEDDASFREWMKDRFKVPSVHGLVLAGGKSLRMGTDKSVMDYHGMPQREYLLGLMDAIGIPAHLSCRPDQAAEFNTDVALIQDRVHGLGPFGAIISAMMSAPDHAWLVVASDLPFVTQATLRELLDSRDLSKTATAFHNPATGFPEPLITLWEPKAYPVLLSFLAQGISCPRKVLINSPIHSIDARPKWLMNVNTPDDAESAKKQLPGHAQIS